MTMVTKAGVIIDNSIIVPPCKGPFRVKLPPEPTPYDDYIENEVSMRAAKQLTRLVLQQQQQQQQQQSGTGGSLFTGTGNRTPVSGAGRAPSEIFKRRAQLATEMSKLGLPPMVNWGDAGQFGLSGMHPRQGQPCSHVVGVPDAAWC